MEITKYYTKAPNQLLRGNIDLTASERLFLIYILSHKEGYKLTDVQASDNLGLSRATVKKVKDKLSLKGYFTVNKNNSKGYTYNIHLEKIISANSVNRLDKCIENDINKIKKIETAFKNGLNKFTCDKRFKSVEDDEYFISGRWHKKPYKTSLGDIKNIKYFLKNNCTSHIEKFIQSLDENLHNYLYIKIKTYDFNDYKTGKNITPTISFFIRSAQAQEDLMDY